MLTARSLNRRYGVSLVSLVLSWLTGCGEVKTPAAGGWRVVYDTIGDTVVVRTVAGSIWGDTA